MSLISVIVPVYNAAPFLSKCVESILAQQVEDIELILVNDGSKDSSLDVCNDYAARDSRIKVVNKPNGGVSSARNCGLDCATGEWVTFVDADDWLLDGALMQSLSYGEQYDIIRFSAIDFFAGAKTRYRKTRYAKDRDEAFSQVVGHYTLSAVWGAIYRRRLFEDNGIRFDTNIVYGEDWLALAQAMYYSKSVKILPDLYGYGYNRLNESSCSNTISREKLIQSLVVVRELRDMVGDRYAEELTRSRCYRTGVLVKQFGCKATYDALVANRERIDIITLRDILSAKLHLSLRCRLLRLWLGYLAWR
uniref:glycosyltransferase family 2 protein n=1 Tax=Alistipes sp. TaxID=1872444 RepID=UPI0040560F05